MGYIEDAILARKLASSFFTSVVDVSIGGGFVRS
jgi:hypothetical protein